MDPRVDPRGVLRAMEDAVRGLGLPFVCTNQEYDPSQWEINCRYADALVAADEAHLLKLAIKEIAAMHGLVATFIGRPMEGGTSATTSTCPPGTTPEGISSPTPPTTKALSETARWFIGGLIDHARGTTAVMAPTINAYKRFMAQELARTSSTGGPTTAPSSPASLPSREGDQSRGRGADGSASPYSSSAGQIRRARRHRSHARPGSASREVYYRPVERQTMPPSLAEALDALEADAFVREKMRKVRPGLHDDQAQRVRRFSLAVTDWEIREYLEAL